MWYCNLFFLFRFNQIGIAQWVKIYYYLRKFDADISCFPSLPNNLQISFDIGQLDGKESGLTAWKKSLNSWMAKRIWSPAFTKHKFLSFCMELKLFESKSGGIVKQVVRSDCNSPWKWTQLGSFLLWGQLGSSWQCAQFSSPWQWTQLGNSR